MAKGLETRTSNKETPPPPPPPPGQLLQSIKSPNKQQTTGPIPHGAPRSPFFTFEVRRALSTLDLDVALPRLPPIPPPMLEERLPEADSLPSSRPPPLPRRPPLPASPSPPRRLRSSARICLASFGTSGCFVASPWYTAVASSSCNYGTYAMACDVVGWLGKL